MKTRIKRVLTQQNYELYRQLFINKTKFLLLFLQIQ